MNEVIPPTPRSTRAIFELAVPLGPTYVYVADGLTRASLTGDVVVALDRETNHTVERNGVNVLFGDGHVEFMMTRTFGDKTDSTPRPDWTSVKQQIADGVRPVRWPQPAKG